MNASTKIRRRAICTSFAVGMLAATTSSYADVDYTVINPPSGGEASHQEIFESLYGGLWNSEGVRDYSNGSLSAVRIADAGDDNATTRSPFIAADDRLWAGGQLELQVVWKDAGDTHTFGWFDDTPGADSSYQMIGSSSDHTSVYTMSMPGDMRWGLHDQTLGRVYTSDDEDNVFATGPRDMLVTYEITGHADGQTRWLLFWEDRMPGDNWFDDDFNDVVIEVRSVPAPGSLALLAAAGLIARRRRPRSGKRD